MKRQPDGAEISRMSQIASLLTVSPPERARMGKALGKDVLAQKLAEFEKEIDAGRSAEVIDRIVSLLESHAIDIEHQAALRRLLSLALEAEGQYPECLSVIATFEPNDLLEKLRIPLNVMILAQLGAAYVANNVSPKAIGVLNSALEIAEKRDLTEQYCEIYLAFASAYRRLSEYPIARNYAEKAIKYAREAGDWRGMAEAYRTSGSSYLEEHNSERALEYFNQALRLIGDRDAALMAGKIYLGISAAQRFLRQATEAVNAAKKAAELFERSGNVVLRLTATNNIADSLILAGNLKKARQIIEEVVAAATQSKHPKLYIFVDTLGEIALLEGSFDEALDSFDRAYSAAKSAGTDWYAVKILKNISAVLLAKGEYDAASQKAHEAIELCEKIGEIRTCILAGLISCEAQIKSGATQEAEKLLARIEENEHATDFFTIGNIARLRAHLSLAAGDEDQAIQQFGRCLSIFEMAHDPYQTALTDLELGAALKSTQPEKAEKHLVAARESFKKMGVGYLEKRAQNELENSVPSAPSKPIGHTVNSELLMMRLSEAVASRELLFRELITIIKEEGRASKSFIAELNAQGKLTPSVIDGFTPPETVELAARMQDAQMRNDLSDFAVTKNLAIFHLKTSAAPHAYLAISPASGAVVADGGPLQPLLRVVELGMDICALREKDKEKEKTDGEGGDYLNGPFISQSLMPGFIHSSKAMTALVDEIYRIRSSDVTVLITGESGTGKELVSRAIHVLSQRKDKIFVPFNCTAVPKELTEGHLFGYKKGSFTGAVADSPGMIRSAHGGTLFLDEIGDLALDAQPKILRFLQESEVQPLGEKAPIKVDVRIIAATNMNLEEKVEQGLFREDLYYRLNVIRLRVPPLRERKSEIPQIVNYYINHYSAKFGRADLTVSSQTMDLLITHNWEGNVRQLCNEVQRMVARADNGETITPSHLSPDVVKAISGGQAKIPAYEPESNVRPINLSGSFNVTTEGRTLEQAVSELETQMIIDALKKHKGNISRVAKELGLTRRGLYLKLERYNLDKDAIAS